MKARLVCRLRAGAAQTFDIGQAEAVLGREAGLTVSLRLDGISRRHARITWDGQLYWLEDLGSTNGTFLNGQAVRRERLRHLDVVTLGRKVDLVFVLRGEELQPVRRKGVVRAALVEAEGDERHDVPTGEVTLGRSTACNVIVAGGAVSSLHARILRGPEQVVLEDLGSANGTFVNGARVMTTELHQGDLVSLAGVAAFRVELELGEVLTSSGVQPRPDGLATMARARQQFSAEWKTRFEWTSGEREVFEALRAGVAPPPEDLVPPSAQLPPAAERGRTGPTPAQRPAPAQPAAAAARPPAKPESAAPAAPARPAAVPAAKPAAPAAAPAAARPAAAAPAPVAPAPVPPPALTAASASTAPSGIQAIILTSSLGELRVAEPGAHILGRGTDAALRVQHPTVSRRHARLILSDDRSTAYLQDAGGANGTSLNGTQVTQLAPLANGDRIRVGEVELTVALVRA